MPGLESGCDLEQLRRKVVGWACWEYSQAVVRVFEVSSREEEPVYCGWYVVFTEQEWGKASLRRAEIC